MVPKFMTVPWLKNPLDVTVIPDGIVTVSPELIVFGGFAPPHVAGSFQFPLCTAVNVVACAS